MVSPEEHGDAQLAVAQPSAPQASDRPQQHAVSQPLDLATPRIMSDNEGMSVGPEFPTTEDLMQKSTSQETPQQLADIAPAVARGPEPIVHPVSTSTPTSVPIPDPIPGTAPLKQDQPTEVTELPKFSILDQTADLEEKQSPPPGLVDDAVTTTPTLPESRTQVGDAAQPTQPPKNPGSTLEISDIPISESEHSSCIPDTHIEHDYDEVDGHRICRLKPTAAQWKDFPAVLAFAKKLGVQGDGCFKVTIPDGLHDPLPDKPAKVVPANAYKVKQIKKTTFWQVSTVPSDGEFGSFKTGPDFCDSVDTALKNLKRLFRSNKDRQMRSVRYRVDVPAWTPRQRLEAGVPEKSPIHPLKGDKLNYTKAVIPGIHTPYVYESGPHFGATFQIHAEDFRLASLNHLYKGRKIWIVIPATAVDIAEKALGRGEGCSQFMRHRCEFFFPDKLDKLGIPYRLVDQRPGETIVILPDAYHEGFSTGYTIAEAKNYADETWNTDSYQPCQTSCRLVTAIPASLMRPIEEGEDRLNLCAAYGDDGRLIPLETLHKRAASDLGGEPNAVEQFDLGTADACTGTLLDERGAKRIKT